MRPSLQFPSPPHLPPSCSLYFGRTTTLTKNHRPTFSPRSPHRLISDRSPLSSPRHDLHDQLSCQTSIAKTCHKLPTSSSFFSFRPGFNGSPLHWTFCMNLSSPLFFLSGPLSHQKISMFIHLYLCLRFSALGIMSRLKFLPFLPPDLLPTYRSRPLWSLWTVLCWVSLVYH